MLRLLRALPSELSSLSWAARRALETAVRACLEGDRDGALAALDEVMVHDPRVPATRLIAAQVRYALRQYSQAFEELDAAASLRAERFADELRYDFCARLGWFQEAQATIERRLRDPRNARAWRHRAVSLFGSAGHHRAALEHLDALMAMSPPSAALELNAAHLSARAGDHGRVRAHALRSVELEPGRGALRTAAAFLLAQHGCAKEALEQAGHAIELDSAPASFAAHAELSLWLKDLDAALDHATRCAGGAGLRVRGAVAALRGDYDRALGDLDGAVDRDPSDATAHAWRAEVLLRSGRFDDARAAAERSIACADGFPFAAELILRLATLRGELGAPGCVPEPAFDEIRAAAAEILPSSRASFATGERHAVMGTLEALLGCLGGNRGDHPTWLASNGALRPIAHDRVRRDALRRVGPLDDRAREADRVERQTMDARDASALEEVLRWLEERRTPAETLALARSGEQVRDVEVVALRAGVRHAVRASVLLADVADARRRYAQAGLASLVSPEPALYDGDLHSIIFVGRTEADARRALEAEQSNDDALLGGLLGYPDCCIAEFVKRPDSPHPFLAAKAAWVPRPISRLNNLFFGAGARFVSFEPCRYDCPKAASVADAIAAALAQISAESVAWCDAQLAQAAAIDSDGGRARVVLDGARITSAEAIRSIPDQPIGAAARMLAERLVGELVQPDGTVRVGMAAEVMVFDFGWPSRSG